MIYTTNAIENINAQLRKIIKTRGHFPTDEAATKLIWLALHNITATWKKMSCPGVGTGHEPARYPLCGSIRSAVRVILNPALNTEILTLPVYLSGTDR